VDTTVRITIFEKKQDVILLQLKNDAYEVVKKMKVVQTDQVFVYRDKAFKLDPNMILWRGGAIAYDIDSVTPLTFETLAKKKRPEDLASWMKSSALQRLVSGDLAKIYLIVICICVGLGILGTALGQYQLQQANSNIAHLTEHWINSTRAVR